MLLGNKMKMQEKKIKRVERKKEKIIAGSEGLFQPAGRNYAKKRFTLNPYNKKK